MLKLAKKYYDNYFPYSPNAFDELPDAYKYECCNRMIFNYFNNKKLEYDLIDFFWYFNELWC